MSRFAANLSRLCMTYIVNFKYAVAELGKHGIIPLIEAINTPDIPGCHLNTQDQSYAVLEEISALN